MDSTPGSKMDLYARAAATLYGIIITSEKQSRKKMQKVVK